MKINCNLDQETAAWIITGIYTRNLETLLESFM